MSVTVVADICKQAASHRSETVGSHTPLVVAVAGYFWGYLAISGAKSYVIFLLGDPISCKGDEISRLSRLVFEI